LIAAAISGSASANEAEKKVSGAEAAVLAVELMGGISPAPPPEMGADGSKMAVGSGASRLAHPARMAKRLRPKAIIYARYGGETRPMGAESCPRHVQALPTDRAAGAAIRTSDSP
jgi:hypothetical protein